MFGLGTTELLILLGIIVIFFGASKLPQLGQGLGQGIKNFKKSMKEKNEIDITPENEEDEQKEQSSDKTSEKKDDPS